MALFAAGTEPKIQWYDRQGKPIKNVIEWGKLHEQKDYKIVKQERLKNGVFVSTVWLGLDHRYDETKGKPLIFESMVFWKKYQELEMRRYSTEHQAIYNHNRMVREWSGWKGVWRVIKYLFDYYYTELKWKIRR